MSSHLDWPVMVLAHNEEAKIGSCLDSIFASEPNAKLEVFVMANGCTDRTEDIVREYSRKRPEVRLVSIKLGDKCNAWNVFIHETIPTQCPGRDVYFFMDGDARIGHEALSKMASALQTDTYAHAAAAVPATGRNMKKDRNEILERRGLVANLYALRGSFAERLKHLGARLPLNLEGDDGLLGAMIKFNLDAQAKWDDYLIHPCADATFEFDPVPIGSLEEWPKYWRRLVRYGRREFEFKLIGPRLKRDGVAGLPRDVRDLYPEAQHLKPVWRGIYTLTHLIALHEMRKIGRTRLGASGAAR